MDLGFNHQGGAGAVAASAVASGAVLDPGRSCCRSSQLGLQPGDKLEIKLGRKQIKLIPLGATEED